jgi:hypothetical protein
MLVQWADGKVKVQKAKGKAGCARTFAFCALRFAF